MEKKNLAFDRMNYVLLGIGAAVILLGLILMSGSGTPESGEFNPDIFSSRRIVVAPVTCFFGFVFIIYAIMHKPKTVKEEQLSEPTESTESTTLM